MQNDTDIAQLMQRDPHEHTDEDITSMIVYYRSKRNNFNLTGAVTPKPKTAAQQEKLKLVDELDLGGL